MSTTRGKLSPWAVLAIVLSIGLCPFVTAAAILAGLWALRDVSVNGRSGRRLAWAAIVIGIIVTPLSGTAMWWWTVHVRSPLLTGPVALIEAGQSGDVAALVAAGGGAGTKADAETFLKSLTSRFGMIQSTRPAEASGEQVPEDQSVQPTAATGLGPGGDVPAASSDSGWWIWVPYDAMFERGAATLHARFLLSEPSRGWVTTFDRFEFDMPDGRLLQWPATEDGESTR
jgi:hypothetical protein